MKGVFLLLIIIITCLTISFSFQSKLKCKNQEETDKEKALVAFIVFTAISLSSAIVLFFIDGQTTKILIITTLFLSIITGGMGMNISSMCEYDEENINIPSAVGFMTGMNVTILICLIFLLLNKDYDRRGSFSSLDLTRFPSFSGSRGSGGSGRSEVFDFFGFGRNKRRKLK